MTEDEKQLKRFEIAIQIRNFEIELFWKRALFFWGFISSAFIGYAALHKSSPDLGLTIACFGMVCSFAWTLLNRGSKFWQESWEAKVEREESSAVGEFLAIALSDYVFLLWFSLVVFELLKRYPSIYTLKLLSNGACWFVFFSLAYLALLFFGGRSGSPVSK
jgi:hypothetical protein